MGGNYFYIVIDHAAQGENTVHFLNQVDEKDLLTIIDEKDILTAKSELPKQEQPKQETENPKPEEKPEKKNPAGMIALSLILILGLAGGAFYYFKFLKPKQNVKRRAGASLMKSLGKLQSAPILSALSMQ